MRQPDFKSFAKLKESPRGRVVYFSTVAKKFRTEVTRQMEGLYWRVIINCTSLRGIQNNQTVIVNVSSEASFGFTSSKAWMLMFCPLLQEPSLRFYTQYLTIKKLSRSSYLWGAEGWVFFNGRENNKTHFVAKSGESWLRMNGSWSWILLGNSIRDFSKTFNCVDLFPAKGIHWVCRF